MRIEYLGGNNPDIAVVGGIHGDEPCGVNAVKRLLEESPDLQRSVVFVIANEKAIDAETRYVEEDLNRVFPGDENGQTHESQLAAELHDVIGDCLTLSMHSTQSYDGPFALVDGITDEVRRPLRELTLDAVVDVGPHSKGRVFEVIPRTIEVECGYQGSEQATENAIQLVWEFLAATGSLPPESDFSPDEEPAASNIEETPLFRLDRQIPKDEAESYNVYASNFEQVVEGQPFAAAGQKQIIAMESFYPVLLSAYGYESVFGYTAQQLGNVSEVEKCAEVTQESVGRS